MQSMELVEQVKYAAIHVLARLQCQRRLLRPKAAKLIYIPVQLIQGANYSSIDRIVLQKVCGKRGASVTPFLMEQGIFDFTYLSI